MISDFEARSKPMAVCIFMALDMILPTTSAGESGESFSDVLMFRNACLTNLPLYGKCTVTASETD